MLELSVSSAIVIRCFANSAAIDALQAPSDAFPCRVAPDELLVLVPGDAGESVLADLSDELGAFDPDGLVLDQTDGFTLWTLAGDAAEVAFARLSAIPLPVTRPCFVQGLVVRVPAKTIAFSGELHILVSSTVGHHARAQILDTCGDLGVTEAPPRLFSGAGVT